jgi:hypothetical protein
LIGNGNSLAVNISNVNTTANIKSLGFLKDTGDTATGNYSFNNGNIGIGTTTPEDKLHIKSDLYSVLKLQRNSTTAGHGSAIRFGISTTDTVEQAEIRAERVDADSADLIFKTDSDAMIITSEGLVGIGTTSPDSSVHIAKLGSNTSYSDINYSRIFQVSQFLISNLGFAPYDTLLSSAYNGADIIFGTRSGGVNYERIRLTDAGNLGIGTASPQSLLGVSGSSGSTFISVKDTRSNIGDLAGIRFSSSSNVDQSFKTGISHIETGSNGIGDLIFATDPNDTAGDVNFLTDERMRITSSGDVGIGTASPTHKLHVAGSVLFQGNLDIKNSTGNKYLLRVLAGNNAGYLELYDESENNDIRFITRAGYNSWINNGGNLGIGTANPSSTLHVVGTANITDVVYVAGSQVCTSTNGLCAGAIPSSATFQNINVTTLLNVSGSAYVGTGRVCTENNGLCAGAVPSSASFTNLNVTGVLNTTGFFTENDLTYAQAIIETKGYKRFFIEDPDLCGSITTTGNPWFGTQLASGTMTASNGYQTHPCVRVLRTATTAYGGYALSTGSSQFLLNGTEEFNAIFSLAPRTSNYGNQTNVTIGFTDSVTNALPTDGVYVYVANRTARAYVRTNNVLYNSSSKGFNLTDNAYYRLNIQIVNYTRANFYLYNSTSTTGAGNTNLIYSDVVQNAVLPMGSGRQTGAGVVVHTGSDNKAADLLFMDYMSVHFNKKINR